jgi:phosphosulfolactate synthase
MVIDNGLPTSYFRDAVSSAAEFIDLVKFGWGTALVTAGLNQKIQTLRALGIGYFFGGTLFEKHVLQGRFEEYREFCQVHGCRHVEVSNGTIELPNAKKDAYIEKLSEEFTVLSEVGFKDGERSERFSPSRWVDCIRADLEAGANLVITEARESGRGGICRPDGRLRLGLIEDILDAGLPTERLLFEAPTKDLQTFFVRRVGTEVNLGNIAPTEVIALETLRLGLRADTLLAVEAGLTGLAAGGAGGTLGVAEPAAMAAWGAHA